MTENEILNGEGIFYKTDTNTGCWNWLKQKNHRGYAQCYFDGKTRRVTRLIYRFLHGEFDSKKVIMHKCDNPSCINPDHLKLGTQSENILDASSKKRLPTLKGEKSHLSKLNWNKVRKIRNTYKQGNYTNKELGSIFGVHPSNISYIVNHKTWKEDV